MEPEIKPHTVPVPYLRSTWQRWETIWQQKLLKITLPLRQLWSSNFGRIPAFDIRIFISSERKCDHCVSTAGRGGLSGAR